MLKHLPPKTMSLNEKEWEKMSEQIKQYGIRNTNVTSVAPPIDKRFDLINDDISMLYPYHINPKDFYDNYPIRSLYYVKPMEQKQNKNEETKIITIKKIKQIKEKINSNKEELNELKNEDYGLSIV